MKLSPLILGTDLIADWVEYTSDQEAPASMLVASMLTLFAGVLERRLWIRRGYMKRSNVYTILLGPPATRKGQAMKLSLQVFKDIGLRPRLFGQYNATDEGIVTALTRAEEAGKSAAGLLFAEELGTLFGKKQYQESFMTFMTRAYDGGELEATRRMDSYGCKDGQLSMLGATTPADFKRLPHGVVTTGLMSRTWIVNEAGPARERSRPKFDPALLESIKQRLRDRILHIGTLGQLHYEPGKEADEVFDAFYLGEHSKMKRECDPIMQDWTGRRHDHAMTSAVLMHLIDGGGPQEVLGREGIERGIAFVKAMEEGIAEAYGATLLSDWGVLREWTIDWLKRRGGANTADFKRAVGGRGKTAGAGERMLKELQEQEAVAWDGAKGKWRVVE